MSDPNHTRSKAASQSGAGGREVNRPRRRHTGRTTQTQPSSTRSRRGHRQPDSSSVSTNGTDGHRPNTNGSQPLLPPGWIEVDGYWYYPTPDGQYHLWHNDGTFEEDAEQLHASPAGNDGGHNEQDTNGDLAGRSWDEYSSRSPNQGSASSASTQGGTEADVGRRNEWHSPVQEEFLDGNGPWSAEGSPLQGNMDGYVAYAGHDQEVAGSTYNYPPSIELDGDEEAPPTSAPRA